MGTTIKKLLKEIIPPADYEHRNGFTNTQEIDRLKGLERAEVEKALIEMLETQPIAQLDDLIVDTLAYMKSELSLPLLYDLLKKSISEEMRIRIAVAIFQIRSDAKMIPIAMESFKTLVNKQDAYYSTRLIGAFYYLAIFKDPEVNKMINEYTSHSNMLVAFNAKRALTPE